MAKAFVLLCSTLKRETSNEPLQNHACEFLSFDAEKGKVTSICAGTSCDTACSSAAGEALRHVAVRQPDTAAFLGELLRGRVGLLAATPKQGEKAAAGALKIAAAARARTR